jgi:hypothetical protein
LERQLVVSAGIQRQLVVGNDQGSLLRLAQAASSITGTSPIPNFVAASSRPWRNDATMAVD